jgi:hypothetical protein
MAKVYEEVIVIKVSKLIKDNADVASIANEDVIVALEQVAQELVGSGVIVEIERA